MTKLEELKAVMDAAEAAYKDAKANDLAANDAAYTNSAARNAAYGALDAYDDAWFAYQEELEKQNDKA